MHTEEGPPQEGHLKEGTSEAERLLGKPLKAGLLWEESLNTQRRYSGFPDIERLQTCVKPWVVLLFKPYKSLVCKFVSIKFISIFSDTHSIYSYIVVDNAL